jgi:hypothetical protein
MDFIMDLPLYNLYDPILVVVDHLTKMACFIFCIKIIIAKKPSSYFLTYFLIYGLHNDIIYDHGP